MRVEFLKLLCKSVLSQQSSRLVVKPGCRFANSWVKYRQLKRRVPIMPIIVDKIGPLDPFPLSTDPVEPPDPVFHTYNFDVCTDPEVWKHVENVLPVDMTPDPPKKAEYPSGWCPPPEQQPDLPYFIERNVNLNLPVYLSITVNNTRRITSVRKVHGDLWAFEKDIRKYMEKLLKRVVMTRCNEVMQCVMVKGDHVADIKARLYKLGF